MAKEQVKVTEKEMKELQRLVGLGRLMEHMASDYVTRGN